MIDGRTTLRELVATHETSLQLASLSAGLDVFDTWTVDRAIEDLYPLIVLVDAPLHRPELSDVVAEIVRILADVETDRRERRISASGATEDDLLHVTTVRQFLEANPHWVDWLDGPRDLRAIRVLGERPEVMDVPIAQILCDPDGFRSAVDRYDGQPLSRTVRGRILEVVEFRLRMPGALGSWWEHGWTPSSRFATDLADELLFLAGRNRFDVALSTIPERHAQALRLRYGLDDGIPLKLSDVGDMLGVGQSRALQLVDRGLRSLRVRLYAHRDSLLGEATPRIWSSLADRRGVCSPHDREPWPADVSARDRLLMAVFHLWTPIMFVKNLGRPVLGGWELAGPEVPPEPTAEMPEDDEEALAGMRLG